MSNATQPAKSSADSATASAAAAQRRASFLRTTRAVADETRLSVLRALQQESFGVLELCDILQIAQPALSHHLKILHEAELVAKRREGNHIYYRRRPSEAMGLTEGILAAIDDLPLEPAIGDRMVAVQQARREQSQAFFDSHAEDFASQQAQICDNRVYASIAMDMVARHCPQTKRALEIGPGDGSMLGALANAFDQVLGIDSSAHMLKNSAKVAATHEQVRLRQIDFLELGQSNRFELIMASMVVHHMPSPAQFFHQARTLLTRSGALLIAELCPQHQQWAQEACGDLWLGLATEDLHQWAVAAGFQACDSQFLAERNGFRIQLLAFKPASRSAKPGRSPTNQEANP